MGEEGNYYTGSQILSTSWVSRWKGEKFLYCFYRTFLFKLRKNFFDLILDWFDFLNTCSGKWYFLIANQIMHLTTHKLIIICVNKSKSSWNLLQATLLCERKNFSSNPYEFYRKMNNIFKDTIPKGGNFKRRILSKPKMNVTEVHRCFSKLNLWVKFSCPTLNNKVNNANIKVVFSAKNISLKSNQTR